MPCQVVWLGQPRSLGLNTECNAILTQGAFRCPVAFCGCLSIPMSSILELHSPCRPLLDHGSPGGRGSPLRAKVSVATSLLPEDSHVATPSQREPRKCIEKERTKVGHSEPQSQFALKSHLPMSLHNSDISHQFSIDNVH